MFKPLGVLSAKLPELRMALVNSRKINYRELLQSVLRSDEPKFDLEHLKPSLVARLQF